MRNIKAIVAGAVLAGGVAVSQAQAQSDVLVSGYTLGCFYTTTICTPTTSSTSVGGSLAFSGSTFSDMTVGGFTAFGGNPSPGANVNNFGSLSVGSGAFNYGAFGEHFLLRLVFTSPATTPPNGTIDALDTIIGSVNSSGQGGIFVDFANNSFQNVPGGSANNLRVSVNDLSVDAGQIGAFNGNVLASTVPEPSTYALMTTGLLGLIGAARMRRRSV